MVVVHDFSPSTQVAEAGESLNLRPAWSTDQGKPGLYRETLSLKTNKQTKNVSHSRFYKNVEWDQV